MTHSNTPGTSSSTWRDSDSDAQDSTIEDAKKLGQELSSSAQEKTGDALKEARQTASGLAEDAKQKANEYAHEAKQTAQSAAEQRKDSAATRLEGVASGLREAGRKMHEEDEDMFARYADSAASGVEDFSNYLRNHSTGDLFHEVEGFARRQPEVFLAGALAAGFFLGRFFKSSGRRSTGSQNYGSYDGRSGYVDENSYGQNPYGQNNAYQERRYVNRPYENTPGENRSEEYAAEELVTGHERVDRSSAIGSTGTVSRSWDANDVDSVTNGADTHNDAHTDAGESSDINKGI
jgi:uncharacterized protein YjbJ (UPF0337 family)